VWVRAKPRLSGDAAANSCSAFPHHTTPHNMASLPDMAELKLMKDNVWRKQQALKGEEEILADWNEQESIRDTVHGSH
jgi:hypothetical protein